ncbi:uncharacterized protein MKK02DRAFT_38223 [Dioszegia hungarica]|uniref:Transmembrane protein n=1 Tax=Dioszegia hungarica TaxID=4972 RepID=A0AA38LQT3_9TREE|nr:uncharacterized protein MKK02DRAFT_38223 [Dioszegia hungarica]KAI9633567.1 hypothetical protein MKK02DRAFT_38223 [Dioszegia hungarica]
MAGPNMEVFRFGFYLFFPIFAMYKFGDPVWFETYVQPYKDYLLPSYEDSLKPPKTAAGLHEELARLKAARKAKYTSTSADASDLSVSASSQPPAPSRTLEALATDQAMKRDQGVSGDLGSGPGAVGEQQQPSQGRRWGWGSGGGSSSERLV